VPHITLKSIANNAEIDVIWEARQPAVEAARAELNAALAGHPEPFPVTTGGRAGKSIDFTATGTITLPSGEEAPATDPLVTETIVPGAEFVSIDVPPNAAVVQVEDRVFSNASLLVRPGAEERRREVLGVIGSEVAAASQGVLLVATRDVLRRLHQDVDPARAAQTDDDLMRPLLGAHPRWFGPGMQGLNAYEDFETAIIVGRLQPRIDVIEDQMRAIFGNGEAPLECRKTVRSAAGMQRSDPRT